MNNIISKFLFFYPVRLIRGENVIRFLHDTKKVEFLSKDDLINFQNIKLQKLLDSKNQIPYLKKILHTHKKTRSIKDLEFFPIINKKFIIENLRELKNKTIFQTTSRSTSGSSGQPFTFYRDRYSLASMDAIMYNAYSWHGIKIGDRQARFWGMPINKKKYREAILKDSLMNRVRLSAFNLTDNALNTYFHKLVRFQPNYFYGYPSLIYEFAKFCDSQKLPIESIKIKAIITTGEKQISSQIEYIESVFQTRVIQEYGCSELGVIAFQCKFNNMHIMSPNIILEVVKKNIPVVDEPGEIVITELNARSYPFIRYKIGDIGVHLSEKCTCGLHWPLMEITEGRRDDYIIAPDGRKVYDAILAYTFNKFRQEIIKFKAVQKQNGNLEIMLITTPSYNATVEQDCIKQLKSALSNELKIIISKVDNIPREKSGKLRYFFSEYNNQGE